MLKMVKRDRSIITGNQVGPFALNKQAIPSLKAYLALQNNNCTAHLQIYK